MHSLNVAASLLVQMRRDGVARADRVELNDSGRLIRVVQSGPSGLREHEVATVPLDTGQAAERSIHASSDQLATLAQDSRLSRPTPVRSETQAPALAR